MSHAMRASAIVLSLVAGGCGGDDDDGGDTTGVSTGPLTSGPGSTGAPDDDGTPGSTGSGDSGMASSEGGDSPSTGDGMGSSAGDDTSGSGSDTGAAAPTWDGFASGFFETYCWECHGPGDALRDYSTLAGVMAESNAIRCGTAPAGANLDGCEGEPPEEQFPVGATIPTADERAMLVAWIDAGLPEN